MRVRASTLSQIERYRAHRGIAPTKADLQSIMGSHAHDLDQRLDALIRQGLITITPHGRIIRTVGKAATETMT